MTVQQLLKLLEPCSPDTEVLVDRGGAYGTCRSVQLDEQYGKPVVFISDEEVTQ